MYHGEDEAIREAAQKEFEKRMQDPMTRGNIARAMIDIFMSLIIQGFIMIIYPEEALKNMSDQG
jgi:hypothetical protein